MNTLLSIDTANFLRIVRILRPSQSILRNTTLEERQLRPARSLDVLLEAAKTLNPSFAAADGWYGELHIGELVVHYFGFLHQSDPVRRVAQAFAALANRKDLVLKLLNEEFAVIDQKHADEPIYVYMIRSSREIKQPSVLGFENIYLIDLPDFDMWSDVGIGWVLDGAPIPSSENFPNNFDLLKTLGITPD